MRKFKLVLIVTVAIIFINCEKDKKHNAKKMSTANLQNKLRQIVWHDLVDLLKNKKPEK